MAKVTSVTMGYTVTGSFPVLGAVSYRLDTVGKLAIDATTDALAGSFKVVGAGGANPGADPGGRR